MKVRIIPVGFSTKQLAKLERARLLAERVLNSSQFQTAVTGYEWTETITSGALWWKKTRTAIHRDFRWNNGDNRYAVLNRILSGKETYSPDEDQEADIELHLNLQKYNGVLGFGYAGQVGIWINSWFFDSANEAEIAGNLIHEWCHKLGYDHEFRSAAYRQHTVPYAIGYLVAALAA